MSTDQEKKETLPGLKLQTVIIVIALSILLFLFLLSGLLSLGEQLTRVNRILGILFYILIAACIVVGIIHPLLQVWSRPIFSMYMLRDNQGRAKKYWCKKLTNNLRLCHALTDEEKENLLDFLKQGDEADDLLIDFFTKKFSPAIDEHCKKAARTAFTATAISQTAVYDMLSMLSVNLQLIRSIVESCGYRPSNVSLFALYMRVLKAVFLAGGLEEMDLEELLPIFSGNAAMKLPGIVLASVSQGTVNAFTTIRVGIITKKILLADAGPVSMKQARSESYKEALILLKDSGFHKDLLSFAAKKAKNVKSAAASSVRHTWQNIWSQNKKTDFDSSENIESNDDDADLEN